MTTITSSIRQMNINSLFGKSEPSQLGKMPLRINGLLPGQLVRVRSFDEIRQTLDRNGCYQGLPFMPEMERYCGKSFRVLQRAEKTCVLNKPVRKLAGTVTLEGLRCDGSSHDGCQLSCMFFWREAWLTRVSPKIDNGLSVHPSPQANEVLKAKSRPDLYFCQATELYNATTKDVPWWNPGQYLQDLRSHTHSLYGIALQFWRLVCEKIMWLRVRTHEVPGAAMCSKNEEENLSLHPGELVQVKTPAEILQTLDRDGKFQGLFFTMDMFRCCGARFPVAVRVDRLIDESSGKMRMVKNTVFLDRCICDRRRGCARNMCFLWREIWLRRV